MCILFFLLFFFNDTATTEIYTLSLHDALPISQRQVLGGDGDARGRGGGRRQGRQLRLHVDRSEEHTSELQSLAYLVCRLLLEKKKKKLHNPLRNNTRYISCPVSSDETCSRMSI